MGRRMFARHKYNNVVHARSPADRAHAGLISGLEPIQQTFTSGLRNFQPLLLVLWQGSRWFGRLLDIRVGAPQRGLTWSAVRAARNDVSPTGADADKRRPAPLSHYHSFVPDPSMLAPTLLLDFTDGGDTAHDACTVQMCCTLRYAGWGLLAVLPMLDHIADADGQ